MSTQEPAGPYIYQPYPPEERYAGRIYGIGGLPPHITIKGLTRGEAEAMLALIATPRALPMGAAVDG